MRCHGRVPDHRRPVRITPEFIPHAEGSVLIDIGQTRIDRLVRFQREALHPAGAR